MRLFILAAGKGTRLYPLTKNTPKSLIDLGDGTTMLERQIEAAIECEAIDEVVLITGYRAEQIDAKIKQLRTRIPVSTVYNPFYDVSNNLASLWTAHYLMLDQDFLITNGDNIYKKTVFGKVLEAASHDDMIQLTIDTKDVYDDDDMKVTLDPRGRVQRVSKEISMADVGAESVGLVLVKGEKMRRLFTRKLINLMKDKPYLDKFWLEIFNALIEDGFAIDVAEIEASDWREMDFHADAEVIKKEIRNKLREGLSF